MGRRFLTASSRVPLTMACLISILSSKLRGITFFLRIFEFFLWRYYSFGVAVAAWNDLSLSDCSPHAIWNLEFVTQLSLFGTKVELLKL